ncbi:ligase-associated DNA damage response DEXH box helicase [Neochlamydia sp. S13]|uniref:ligase-associated DNA damage response DEXH box helicase n=1 Tax=Neochlamydia sp. S13 TaxID=1353976 RepID=UPI0005A9026B|nr:ligase-associated DNA damage response DEXH box helicase [Neochlamydia sp. S13]BBI16581.1 Putative uncharacterized protein [Neochlamydia sp. S13]
MSNKELAFILDWLKIKEWSPLAFQQEAWKAFFEAKDGLISVPTGAGKTYAAYLAALSHLHHHRAKGVQILYITPLRALASDIQLALQQPILDLKLPYRVEKRTGDTTTSRRVKQAKNPPEILLITPESLALVISNAGAKEQLAHLQAIIIDEWHELLGTKRGVLLELCIARLKSWSKSVRIWGLTATLGNLEEAAQVCVGIDRKASLIVTKMPREVILETLLPSSVEKLPWAGKSGLGMLPYVLAKLSPHQSTLIFTNTRSQAERWYQAIEEAKPEWKNLIGLHHSSIDKKERELIEQRLKEGILKCVVCTSSLDLGIDFSPVEQVIQVGSPKSIARLLQRAGRSSHRPLTPCRLFIVPTHALEIAELKSYRKALQQQLIENRMPLTHTFDVLIQHLVTCAIGGGFNKDEMFKEIKTTYAFKDLTLEEFDSCLEFLIHGGKALTAYPEYKKLVIEENLYKVVDKKIIQFHRLNIGTITSEPHIPVKMANGKSLGIIEENFLSSLKKGDRFLFGGRLLELIQFRDLTAYVRLSKGVPKTAAVWRGGRLPFSAPLGKMLRESLNPSPEIYPENAFLEQILAIQKKLSSIPHENEMLIESLKSREGWHLFFYPFEGKAVHQGLAYIIASRLSKSNHGTFTLSSNDYGLEILSCAPFHEEILNNALFAFDKLEEEITSLINLHELARSSFRDIARISGLIFQGYPGKHKTHRQVQVSSSLLYEVFSKYDPSNLLIQQAKSEVIHQQFELNRILQVLKRLSTSLIILTHPPKLSPLALPLYIERVSGHLTNETLEERIEKIKSSWKRK